MSDRATAAPLPPTFASAPDVAKDATPREGELLPAKLQKDTRLKPKPGQPGYQIPNANRAGRPGRPNKITKELKDMILKALDQAGGVNYLARQAEENPVAFMGLVGKVLPMTVRGTGENGGIILEVVTGVRRDA